VVWPNLLACTLQDQAALDHGDRIIHMMFPGCAMPSIVMPPPLAAQAPARLSTVPVQPPVLSVGLLLLKQTGGNPVTSGAGGSGWVV